ncbi:MAG: hypothetical protein IJD04_03270, partial [Desulfovibrionaceae bacterium]|nr:hypothetical protein [Desulfovibrionaceae bacterium]
MSQSPNAFMPKPQATKMSRKPFYIGGVLGFILLMVFLWGFFNQKGPKEGEQQEQAVVENKNDDKPLVYGENLQGLALPAVPQGPATDSTQTENTPTPQIVVVTGPKEDETLKKELEQLRKHNLQAEIQALGSPL